MSHSFDIAAPHGPRIQIPSDVALDADPYARLRTPAQLRAYYENEGYVVCRGAIPAALCDEADRAFENEVKPYPGFIYRQATANPERHVLTKHGYMLNSILNIQDLHARQFGLFRGLGLAVLTHPALLAAVETILGERGKLVQSMYFEGNPATWAHQDTYYLDSDPPGAMVAAWIALEDIHPGAGRFYVYPRSHLVELVKNGGEFDVALHHERYKKLVLDAIREHGLECRAPALKKGDILLWSSRTIHGSLETTEPGRSRSSFTAHFIPQSRPFLQLQSRNKPLRLRKINGVDIHHPKDQSRLRNRMVLFTETRFPKTFRTVKKLAIKLVTG